MHARRVKKKEKAMGNNGKEGKFEKIKINTHQV